MSSQPRVLGGRYEVGERIGRGGMADVHLGHDIRLGRTVALKMLRTDLARDSSFLARFRREAQSAASLNHPAVVAVYDSGEEHVTEASGAEVSVPYIIMEYVDGRTLREILNDEGPLEPDEAARVTAGVLSALEYSHVRGIVHRDIKPANVMLTSGGAVKVMDFGIARALADTAATMTQSQAVMGTARYLSPEQAQGQDVDERSDLYSTGCLFFELLTGRTPFTGDPVSLVYQHIGEEARAPSTYHSGIPPEYDAVVLHSLVKDRAHRYQSAAAYRHDIHAARAGGPVSDPAWATLTASGAAALGTQTPAEGVPAPVPAMVPVDDETADMPVEEERHRGGFIVLAVLAVLALAAIAFAVYQFLGPGADDDQTPSAPSPATTAPAQVSVPNVVGEPVSTAQLLLQQRGLEPNVVDQVSDQDEGIVVELEPGPSTQVPQGSAVTVYVSSGPDEVSVPDVVGRDLDTATGQIEGAGLAVADEVEEEIDVEVRPGFVIRSDPQSGTTVAPGSDVGLVVASSQTNVPDLEGQTVQRGIQLLTEADLTFEIEYVETGDAEPDTVISQDIAADEEVERGSSVTLEVARAPTVTVSPEPTEPEPTEEPTEPEPTEPEPTDEPTEPEPTDEPTEPEPTDEPTEPEPTDEPTQTIEPPGEDAGDGPGEGEPGEDAGAP